ncbi:tetratricopeptide repeat protein, partial [Tautonia sociabilis]
MSPSSPPIRLPLSLRRRSEPAPAEAFLLPGGGAAAALALLGGPAGEDALVFEVAGGLLVAGGGGEGGPSARPRPNSPAAPGAIRLRRLGASLFLPVDADLVPALLPDEVEGLTRDRGLVVLPGGSVLMFDPSRPLPIPLLLASDPLDAPPWEAPPPGPSRADRLVEVTLERPGDVADDGLDAAGDDIGTEEPRPRDTGAPRRLVGGAQLGIGRGMMWLGQKLGMKGLASFGAGWIGSALSMAPRLGEALLGKQEGALRDLLREFREGDIDRALRRAPPLGKGIERGAATAGTADLPDRDPTYSLPEILGSSAAGGGRAAYWLGGLDVQQELIREYHKAAQAAARRGDYRRAAFIYARLLEDYRLAANALLRGGLARDAALILLEKLDDRPAAARAFEAAGEFDRALELYRAVGDFERAGDLLGRLGEHDLALDAYTAAADRIVDRERDHLRAGELLRSRAGRPDLAVRYFEAGWADRPGPGAIGCALELARSLADEGDADRLRALVVEADALLAPPGLEPDASRFYNELARLADRPALAPCRDELRDLALLGLAGKLRQLAASRPSPGIVSTLFGSAQGWAAELIRDAEYAVRVSCRPSSSPAPAPPRIAELRPCRVADGPLATAAVVPAAGVAFLGTWAGDVVLLELATGRSTRLGRYDMPVASLAAHPSGRAVAVLWHNADSGRTVLAAYSRRPDGSFQMTEGRSETARATEGRPFLAPPSSDTLDAVSYWDGRRHTLLRGPSLSPWAEFPRGDAPDSEGSDVTPGDDDFDDPIPGPSPPPKAALLLPPAGPESLPNLLELGPDSSWAWLAPDLGPVDRIPIPWTPVPPP